MILEAGFQSRSGKRIRRISGLIEIRDYAQMQWMCPFAGVNHLANFDEKCSARVSAHTL